MAILMHEPIEVPSGVRYLGEWNEFDFSKFPDKCILDKQLPGCGFTEECLKCSYPIILASPRIMLINNKKDQHGDDVFLVVNSMDKDPGVDKDLNKQVREVGKTKILTEEEKIKQLEELKQQRSEAFKKIEGDFLEYSTRRRKEGNKPLKILVTYDSYHIIQDLMRKYEPEMFENTYTVVDEFQSILHDARFKSDTEMQFMNTLRSSPKVMFASATPMMEEYLNMLEDFDGLDYFSLDWATQDPTRIIKPDLDVYIMRSVGEKAGQIIQTYLDGKFESVTVTKDGQSSVVTSTEAVLYVNSVNHILTLIKKKNLSPDQVLILCSNTEENQKKVKKLGKGYSIGHVPNPKKGESFPMFTFCTRTVYLGADFYSNCARTFIFSDANIDSLAVDISEDLPQILGRQRWATNPWKNAATFYYRATANYRNMKKTDFQEELDRKMAQTNNLLSVYKKGDNAEKYSLANTYQKLAKSYNYKDDYVAVNTIYTKEGHRILKPVMNKLVYVNELRAFRIQQIDYKDRFAVFSALSKNITPDDFVTKEVSLFLRQYESLTTIHDKLQILCEYDLSEPAREIILGQIPDSDEVKSYYTALSPEKLRALSYNTHKIKKELKIVTFNIDLLINTIYTNFKIGDKLLLSEIKDKLSDLYKSINYTKTPKASDLLIYFNINSYTSTVIIGGKKKRAVGYELVSSNEYIVRNKLKMMKN